MTPAVRRSRSSGGRSRAPWSSSAPRRPPTPQAVAVALPSYWRMGCSPDDFAVISGGAKPDDGRVLPDAGLRVALETLTTRIGRRVRRGGLGPVRDASPLRPGRPRRPAPPTRRCGSGWRKRSRPGAGARQALLPRHPAQPLRRRPSTTWPQRSGAAGARPAIRPWVRIIDREAVRPEPGERASR